MLLPVCGISGQAGDAVIDPASLYVGPYVVKQAQDE
jgi:hypothetical protein